MNNIVKFKSPPDWGINPIPKNQQILGFFDYFVLWGDLSIGLIVLLSGSFLVPGLNLLQVISAVILGSFIGCLLLALTGIIGSKTHAPTMVILRSILGIRGSFIPSILNILQLIGWTTFEFIIMGYSANTIIHSLTGYSNYFLNLVFFAVIVILLSLLGLTGVVRQWLKKFAFWIVILTTTWLSFHIMSNNNLFTMLRRPGNGSLSFWAGVDLVIAMPISWIPLIADYNRFAKSPKSAFLGTFAGYFIGNVWLYIVGALLLLSTNITQEVHGFIPALLSSAGWFALLILLVDETKNAWADLYSSAISTQNIFPKLNQRTLTIIFGFISFFLALMIDITQYENFLYLIGSVFISLFAILLADFFILRKGSIDIDELYHNKGSYWYNRGINWAGIITWIVGIATYQISSRQFPNFSASLVSFVIVTFSYIILMRIKNSAKTKVAAV